MLINVKIYNDSNILFDDLRINYHYLYIKSAFINRLISMKNLQIFVLRKLTLFFSLV